ncbi:MAG: SDR family NAD(P)-dependent oxidoreductase [Pseudomonadota bacterium]
MPQFHSIVLTGATGGIGRALAIALATEGRHLLLMGRDAGRMESVAEAVRNRGAAITCALCSVTDRKAMATHIAAFDAAHPVDLLIVNAGVTVGPDPDGAREPEGAATALIDTNLSSAIDVVEMLLDPMITRRRGRIALVSSLAALRPHGDLLSYSASKAGLRAYGVALGSRLRRFGVGVTVISPGFVTSPMSARHDGPKPMEMSADQAARRIVAGLRAGRSRIAFPLPIVLLSRIANLLPPSLSDRIERTFAARIRPEDGG